MPSQSRRRRAAKPLKKSRASKPKPKHLKSRASRPKSKYSERLQPPAPFAGERADSSSHSRPAHSSVPRVAASGSKTRQQVRNTKRARYIDQAIREIGPSSGDYSSTFSKNAGSRNYWGGGMSW
jgi:hypothetical protein